MTPFKSPGRNISNAAKARERLTRMKLGPLHNGYNSPYESGPSALDQQLMSHDKRAMQRINDEIEINRNMVQNEVGNLGAVL